MEALPLSLLAFAAGVYLLIKVKKEYLSSLFSVLAWFVIGASLISIGFASVECYEECCEEMCGDERGCRMEKEVIIRHGGEGCHPGAMHGCMMHGCKLEGDSCVMEPEACEKLMGKEGCDKLYKERGRCIMSKEECMKMCNPEGAMMHGGHGMKEGKGGCSMGKKEEGRCGHHEE